MAAGRDTLSHYGGGGWTLLGNPYTSALSAASFIPQNEGSIDPNYLALYIYDGSVGPHGIYYFITADDTGWEIPSDGQFFNHNVQAGQGFFVLAVCNSSMFSFGRDMQAHEVSSPMTKSKNSDDRWPGVKLTAGISGSKASTLVVFNEKMTNGLDPGYDIGQLGARSDIQVYSLLLKDNGISFARQALPLPGSDNVTVPIGVDCMKGGTVTFSAEIKPLDGYKYLLEDRITSAVTDLSASSYAVTLPPKTLGSGRFFLHLKNGTTGVDPAPDNTDPGRLHIWVYNGSIIISGEVSGHAVAEIYDFSGKMIYSKNLDEGSLNTITPGQVKSGVYIVKVKDKSGITTCKVVLMPEK